MPAHLETRVGIPIKADMTIDYFRELINRFFKVLPMWESREGTLPVYLESLQVELLGFQSFVPTIKTDASYVTLLSILQYFIDNPDAGQGKVRREVFKAISICNKLCSVLAEEATG